ncbi:phage portal protein [Microbulbifer sp. PSTR4-B]|uniref:phage portal protein n=1 Tax=unclassified Microbulbifer TaxID=2619833 RepID=UPI00403ABF95
MEFPHLAASGFQLSGGVSLSSGAYDAAKTGGRLSTWTANDYGPNESQQFDAPTIRARARDVTRNNGWANSGLESWVANIVGTGIRPSWDLDDERLREDLHTLFTYWAEECDASGALDLYGLQALACRGAVESGASFVRRRIRPLSWGLSVPLQLQLIEADQLAEQLNTRRGGITIRGGIGHNKKARRVNYHFYKEHPGEARFSFHAGNLGTVAVPADQVAHIYRPERPGQNNGLPWVSSVLVRLRELDQYQDAELVRKKTAAMFAAFIEEAQQDNRGIGKAGALGGQATAPGPVSLEPGILQYLAPGQKISFSAPADVGASYEPWLRSELLQFAAGFGPTYEMVTGDLRGVTYSSIRQGVLEFRRKCEMVQAHMMVHQLCRPLARWFMDAAVGSGAIKILDYLQNRRRYTRIDWQPQAWDWVDPEGDQKAAEGKVRAGFKTRRYFANKLGGNAERIDRENARTRKRTQELGLVYTTDAADTDNKGALQKVQTAAASPTEAA